MRLASRLTHLRIQRAGRGAGLLAPTAPTQQRVLTVEQPTLRWWGNTTLIIR